MNKQEIEKLKQEISEALPRDFRAGVICEQENGSCSFGIFHDPYGDVCSAHILVSVSSPVQWEVLKEFAFLFTQKENGIPNDINSFDDGEGHKILIAVDGSHHEEHEFVG